MQEIKSEFRDFQYFIPHRRNFNDQLLMVERALTDLEGIPGKPWNQHQIYGETNKNNYASFYFPMIELLYDAELALFSPFKISNLKI